MQYRLLLHDLVCKSAYIMSLCTV